MFSWTKMVQQSLVTWTFQKWPKRECSIRRQERHIMRVRKSGGTNPTTTRVTFGRSGVCFMNLSLWSLHSGQMTCKDYIRRYLGVFTLKYRMFTLLTWVTWWNRWFKSHLRWDPAVKESSICPVFESELRDSSLKMSFTIARAPYSILSECLRTYCT